MLRLLTEKFNVVNENEEENKTKNILLDTIIENFKLLNIFPKNGKYVNFHSFSQVFLGFQMNIFDLIDLIFG